MSRSSLNIWLLATTLLAAVAVPAAAQPVVKLAPRNGTVPNFSADPRHLILVEDVSHQMRNTAREQTANAKRTEKLEKTTAEIDAKGLSIRLGD
jgi:hypothetical protein